jgi:DNA-binding NtrC family response regulator
VKRSVLYLDDEQGLLNIFQEMFGDIYDVYTVASLAEARRILADCGVDIIISDQSMPEIEGAEFLREAAGMCPDSFRIMLTGQAVVGEMLREISTGIIQAFVRKPWKEEEMRRVLERASARAGRGRKGGEMREDGSGP